MSNHPPPRRGPRPPSPTGSTTSIRSTASKRSTSSTMRTGKSTAVASRPSQFDTAPVEIAQEYVQRPHSSWDSATKEIARIETKAQRVREAMDDTRSQASTVSAYSVPSSVQSKVTVLSKSGHPMAQTPARNSNSAPSLGGAGGGKRRGHLDMLPPRRRSLDDRTGGLTQASLSSLCVSANARQIDMTNEPCESVRSHSSSRLGESSSRLVAGHAGGLSGARGVGGGKAPPRKQSTKPSGTNTNSSATASASPPPELSVSGVSSGLPPKGFTFVAPSAGNQHQQQQQMGVVGGFAPKMAPKRTTR